MTAACLGAGLPAPVLEEIGTRFRVTLDAARGHIPRLDGIDQAILDALSGGVGQSTREIAAHIERRRRLDRQITRLGRCAGTLIYNFGQAARAGGAARA